MASFTIPSGILSLSEPRTIYMDNGVQISYEARKNVVKFGDGYKSIVHTSAPKRIASVSFANREPEEINLIEDYFVYLAGSPLDDLTIFGEEWNGIVTAFSEIIINEEIYGLNATIREK